MVTELTLENRVDHLQLKDQKQQHFLPDSEPETILNVTI